MFALFSSIPMAMSSSSSSSLEILSFDASIYLTFYESLLSLSLILSDSLTVMPIFFFCYREDEEDCTFESELSFFIGYYCLCSYELADPLLSILSNFMSGPSYYYCCCLDSSYICCASRFSFSLTCSRMVPIWPGRLFYCTGLLDCVFTIKSLGPE